jgi:RNA polymerase primary sigma factor
MAISVEGLSKSIEVTADQAEPETSVFHRNPWHEPVKFPKTKVYDLENSTDPLTQYLKDINQLPKRDNVFLLRQYSVWRKFQDNPPHEMPIEEIDQGLLVLRNKLIENNLRLAFSTVKSKIPWEKMSLDLVQAGNLGLIPAIEKFDLERGIKFSTYATIWIEQAVRRYLADHSRVIRLPVHIQEKIRKMEKASLKLEQYLERKPTPQELADYLNKFLIPDEQLYNPEMIEQLSLKSEKLLSLENPVGEDGSTFGDYIQDSYLPIPDEEFEKTEFKEELDLFLSSTLTPIEYKVMRLRFGLDDDPQTLEQVGKTFGKTRERIRQIQEEALFKLRQANPDQLARMKAFLS